MLLQSGVHRRCAFTFTFTFTSHASNSVPLIAFEHLKPVYTKLFKPVFTEAFKPVYTKAFKEIK